MSTRATKTPPHLTRHRFPPWIAHRIIAMVHVGALPGTPDATQTLPEIIACARREALLYKDAGVQVLMIENMHDTPYLKGRVGPEITAAMAVIGYEVKQATGLPCGMQILAGADIEAVSAAHAAGLDFIRAEGFTFAHVADEGIIESRAAELLRHRKAIAADEIAVFVDVKKKHSSHALTADVSIAEEAHAAEFFRANGVIVTGSSTGVPASLPEVQAVKAAVHVPVLVGSGVTAENVNEYLSAADAVIVGSYCKFHGRWSNPPDPDRVRKLVKAVGG